MNAISILCGIAAVYLFASAAVAAAPKDSIVDAPGGGTQDNADGLLAVVGKLKAISLADPGASGAVVYMLLIAAAIAYLGCLEHGLHEYEAGEWLTHNRISNETAIGNNMSQYSGVDNGAAASEFMASFGDL